MKGIKFSSEEVQDMIEEASDDNDYLVDYDLLAKDMIIRKEQQMLAEQELERKRQEMEWGGK